MAGKLLVWDRSLVFFQYALRITSFFTISTLLAFSPLWLVSCWWGLERLTVDFLILVWYTWGLSFSIHFNYLRLGCSGLIYDDWAFLCLKWALSCSWCGCSFPRHDGRSRSSWPDGLTSLRAGQWVYLVRHAVWSYWSLSVRFPFEQQ